MSTLWGGAKNREITMNTEKNKKANRNKCFWLYLHPYVHLSVKKDRAILYNSLNGALLEYTENPEVVNLIKRLDSRNNLWVVKVNAAEINGNVAAFITDLRKNFIGDLMDSALSSGKPVQLKPMIKLNEIDDDVLNIINRRSRKLKDDDITEYLDTMTLYVNDRCSLDCHMCRQAYKQFACCTKADSKNHELSLDAIRKLIRDSGKSRLDSINILGGNLFDYSDFQGLVNLLKESPAVKEYYQHYANIDPERHRDYFRALKDDNSRLNVTVHMPIDSDALQDCLVAVEQDEIDVRFHFLLQSDSELGVLEWLLEKLTDIEYELHPYYNGENLEFFENNVFLDREMVVESKPDQKDIMIRSTVNGVNFGHLTVAADGKIYGNINHPPVGRLDSDHLYNVVEKELNRGRAWCKVRKNVTPCKSCVFNALCPPISNYEYAVGRYDLCHIGPKADKTGEPSNA
jgi:pseudo-rSAM protein